jgi:tRNA-binding EMAP/Myf-like protein
MATAADPAHMLPLTRPVPLLAVVVSNLKARKMQGIASAGMVMAAMSADGSAVELLRACCRLLCLSARWCYAEVMPLRSDVCPPPPPSPFYRAYLLPGPPADAPVGERISFEGIEDGTPATGNQLNKQGKKALEAILSSGDLATNGACEAGWRGHAMTTTTGPVTTATLAGCKIK